ncbi:transcription antitermination factor NusB [Oceanispirochaeta crateris]|uniref:Transcription antitermination protein NusB n=1 Tax=Oceanispirochaeta crateris TaxID=2518645 RepID=A0A5C1QMA4_9SPIO|nr:transcription antitermination factor NusB [Oceanispirochaeta crateris]QEN07696.1 transcription antitermination factor NusB [Oceanispirochaeta crateris]
MGNRRKARILAFQALYSWEISSTEMEDLFQYDWAKEDLTDDVKVFASFLIKGAIDNLPEIDQLIKDSLRNWDFARLEKVSLAILRMSIYALMYQKDIPPKVVIDEAVEITKEFGTDDSYRFVNGILDNIKKKIDEQPS